MGDRIRVLIVDDSAFVRRAVARMLLPLEEVEVVGSAATGLEGLRMTGELKPDVVILDVNMPEMDGLEALQRIMQEHPTNVLMLSTLTARGAEVTLRALELGAVDFVDKASTGTVIDIYSLAPLLREKVLAVAGAAIARPARSAPTAAAVARETPPPDVVVPKPAGRRMYDIVAIGSSTGGPRALLEVLTSLPANLGAGVVIAQHMPPGFTETLAARLDRRSALSVREARDGEIINPDEVLLGPGGMQIWVEKDGPHLRVRVGPGEPDQLHRPSVNHLLRSVAVAAGPRGIGVVLTGMGDDGAQGLQAIRDAAGRTIAEAESSAIIFGMPRAAAPAAEFILPVEQIGPRLAGLCQRRSSTTEGE